MLLQCARLVGIGPFDDTTFVLGEPGERPRLATVVIGGAGAGKTSLLAAVSSTRPGHAVAQLSARPEGGAPGHAVTDWVLGEDDPLRPHALRVISPNAKVEDDDLLRRREQALFDRRAVEGGFAFVAFSGARWFSRAAAPLASPDRTILRHDARATPSFDDASRADLTRETKQALAYAAVGAALAEAGAARGIAADRGLARLEPQAPVAERLAQLEVAMCAAVAAALEGTGIRYEGVDPLRLEPVFSQPAGTASLFDDLPRGARHALALVVLPLRALCAAYPGKDPREAEGVVLVDDAEVQLSQAQQRTLLPRLRRALPSVQWILTTASPAIAEGAEPGEVIAIVRSPGSTKVELYEGTSAVLH